jgi:hypothetical protein
METLEVIQRINNVDQRCGGKETRSLSDPVFALTILFSLLSYTKSRFSGEKFMVQRFRVPNLSRNGYVMLRGDTMQTSSHIHGTNQSITQIWGTIGEQHNAFLYLYDSPLLGLGFGLCLDTTPCGSSRVRDFPLEQYTQRIDVFVAPLSSRGRYGNTIKVAALELGKGFTTYSYQYHGGIFTRVLIFY